MTTHLYVDVDGVLNALAPGAAAGWERFDHAVIHGYLIQWAPELVERLNALAAREDTAMHWLTTWGVEAPNALCPVLGIEGADWPVLGPEDEHIGGRTSSMAATESWWKLDAIRADLPDHVRAVWLDDDLRYDRSALTWVDDRGNLLGIAPALEQGLSRAEIGAVEEFIVLHAEETTQ